MQTHSPFWPLQILVIAIGVWIGCHVVALYQDRAAAENKIHQLIPQADAGLAAKKKLLALAQDVDQLAAKDAGAAQLVAEFKIHAQAPPKPESPPAAK